MLLLNQASDAQLIKCYREDADKEFANRAFETLLNRYKNKVFTAVFMVVKDKYVAEDILQESFIKAIRLINKDSYNEEGKFGPWIIRIARNMSIDYFRKSKRNPTILLEDGTDVFNSLRFADDASHKEGISKEIHQRLKSYILRLPLQQREVLTMRHYAEMSFQDIAEATEVSINTALGRMRYALINLRKMFDQENVTYEHILRE